MSIIGWYYLHENGDMIYKGESGETAADLRESPFVRGLWPLDPEDRAGAWQIVVEALAGGAWEGRVKALAAKWGCTDADAKVYAERIGVRLYKDGDAWCAIRGDFVNLQESPAGLGETALEALAALCRELGYRPAKMWGATFENLVSRPAPAPAPEPAP